MEWLFREYEELKVSELYELLKLRASVFVIEQDCLYQDLDGKDSQATHLLGYKKKTNCLLPHLSTRNNRQRTRQDW